MREKMPTSPPIVQHLLGKGWIVRASLVVDEKLCVVPHAVSGTAHLCQDCVFLGADQGAVKWAHRIATDDQIAGHEMALVSCPWRPRCIPVPDRPAPKPWGKHLSRHCLESGGSRG